jgi:antitoxin component YwqK of YwqJK toxin-antitoxin module
MKKLLLLFIVIPIIVFGQEEKIIDANAITRIDGLRVMKNDSTLVTGKVHGWHKNGQLSWEGKLTDGKFDGRSKAWYENGQLEAEVSWKDGKQDGDWNYWFKNGQLKEQGVYKDGEKNGVFKEWNKHGKLTLEEAYTIGKLIPVN